MLSSYHAPLTLVVVWQEVFATLNKNTRLLETHREGVISFLNMNRMPTALKTKVKSYVRFKFIHDESDRKVRILHRPPSAVATGFCCKDAQDPYLAVQSH